MDLGPRDPVQTPKLRRVQIGGVVRQPYGEWMKQAARNLTDGMQQLCAQLFAVRPVPDE